MALVDLGATETILVQPATGNRTANLPLGLTKETKQWSTAAGLIDSTSKTKKVSFSLPELHANRIIKQLLHMVKVKLSKDTTWL
jgi:hypothetical protein